MEARLGQIGSKPSALKGRVLRQNKIQQRHYAIDGAQKTLYSNAHMAAEAARDLLPATIVDRPKSGMRVPVQQWLGGSLRSLSRELLLGNINQD